MEDYREIREKLELQHKVLHRRVSAIRADLRQTDAPLDADWSEQAQELENDEVLANIEDVSMSNLEQIEAALSRMDHGHYGECIECGEKISLRRLEALPFVTMCIVCARESERASKAN